MIKKRIAYSEFSKWKFRVSKAHDSYLWDQNGKKYIDFTSGWNVTNLGWSHPEITQAACKQAKKSPHSLLWASNEIQEKYARLLTDSLPKNLNVVCRETGGTEANEVAIKIARAATDRKKIIGFRDTYHGQSFATMSLCFRPESVKAISPMLPDFIQVDYPDTYRNRYKEEKVLENFLEKLEKILSKKDVAAIVTEAGIITGGGSTLVAPKGYLKAVRKLTKKYGTLLILDEAGTGFSRIGKLFGMELENVAPDIVTFAKGISNGVVAIGAVVTSADLLEPVVPKTNLVSTFGWMPIACAVALKTLQIHKRKKVWRKAKKDGDYIVRVLKKELKNHSKVGDVRGLGMEIGIDFVKNKKTKKKDTSFVEKVVKNAWNKGLHLVSDNASVIQLMPPLTISRRDLNKGIEILIDSIKEAKN